MSHNINKAVGALILGASLFPLSLHAQTYDIGRQIAAPKLDTLGGRKTTRIFQSADSYYYVPAILPDWAAYQQDVDAVCNSIPTPPTTTVAISSIGQDLSTIFEVDEINEGDNGVADFDEPKFSVNLSIVLDDEAHKAEILKYLRADSNHASASDGSLNPLPYDVVRVLIKIGDETTVFYTNDEGYKKYADETYARMTTIGLDRTVEGTLELTCNQHRLLVDEFRSGNKDIVEGELYYAGTKFSTTSIHYMSSIGITDRVVRELMSEESSKFSYNGTSKSKRWSVNLPVIGDVGTGGETSGGSSLNTQRIVSRDVMQSAISSAVAQSTLLCTGPKGCDRAEKLILQGLNENGLALDLRQVDGVYGLFDGQTKYVTLESSELKGATEAAIKAIRSSKETAEADGVKSSKEEGSTDEVSGKGEIGGKFPIPVDAELYLVSAGSFQNYVNRKIVERIPLADSNARYFFSMVYPNFAYRDELIEDEYIRLQSLKLEKACKVGANFRSRTASVKKTFKGSAPRGWVNAVLAAEKGTYLVAPTAAHTSSDNGTVRGPATVKHPDAKIVNGVWKMYASIKGGFYCKRGKTGFGKSRTCRASGGVHAVQIPLSCLPYLPANGIPDIYNK